MLAVMCAEDKVLILHYQFPHGQAVALPVLCKSINLVHQLFLTLGMTISLRS